MKKILSIIIITLLIICSLGVQGLFFEKTSEETTNTDLGDIFFDIKMSIFMRLVKFPSLSACIIEGDEVIWSNEYGFYDLENKKSATDIKRIIVASFMRSYPNVVVHFTGKLVFKSLPLLILYYI